MSSLSFILRLSRIRTAFRFVSWRRFVLLAGLTTSALWMWPSCADSQSADGEELNFYTSGHPYLEMPFEQLVEHIPELRTVRPAPSQQALTAVLKKTGARVDEFFRDVTNLAAHEEVKQERLSKKHRVQAQDFQYNYLIVVHRDEQPPRFEEFRANAEGKPVTQRGAARKYSITFGFALKCIYFSTAHQPESTFVYLGDGKIGERNTYVVAFAQRPGHTTIAESVSGSWGADSVFVQGIAWVDQDSFQIIRLRTDLLGPPADVGLTRQTTEVTFDEVRLPDVEEALWLPKSVDVYAVFNGQAFRNEHRYSDYERYRVSVRMNVP